MKVKICKMELISEMKILLVINNQEILNLKFNKIEKGITNSFKIMKTRIY